MKRLLVCLFSLGVYTAVAQDAAVTPQMAESRKLFQDMKFGMFIHWGASSVLGNGEWVMNIRNIRKQEYQQLQDVFDPAAFDAAKWVGLAKTAGMKYITLITRHRDGFSNWDTKQSDWKITNTKYGKDVVKAIADECHKQGIKLFFYYSLLDWYRDDYQYETGKTGKGTGRTAKSNWPSYINFMKAQLTELLTIYGEIGGIWFDGHWDQLDNDHDKSLQSKVDWQYDEIYGLIHKLQPGCMIGNNHHLSPIKGEDFQMFEKDLPGANTSGFGGAAVSQLPLESCETMNDSWGYNITDRKFKSVKQLIHYLVGAAGRNANFLLNVGPMPTGVIQPEFTDTLARIGAWMQRYGESIYGTRGNLIAPQSWGLLTGTNKHLYAHILQPIPGQDYIFIPGVAQKITAAVALKDNSTVRFKQQPEGIFVYVGKGDPSEIDHVIRLQL